MKINKPIFIVGVPRSGTTLLGGILAQSPEISLLKEANFIWMYGHLNKPNDVLEASDITSQIQSHIYQRMTEYIDGDQTRICDKTPRNSLRIPFIYSLFPDAKIIHLIRDGRAVTNSIKNSFEGSRGVVINEIKKRIKRISIFELRFYIHRLKSSFKRLTSRSYDYWGARPPGWNEWVGKYSSCTIAAKQWAETIQMAIDEGRKLPKDNYLEVHYEKLMSSPKEEIEKITKFLELNHSDLVSNYAVSTIDPSRIEKWRESLSQNELDEVKSIIEPMLTQLGYSWS